ncbi:MAG: sulfur carrier protein ThiS [Candidatus Edwardsbacteria bacterium]|nr:sulfur carrier protein ThiS [Candidatus Edwardsbacteria bacterium]
MNLTVNGSPRDYAGPPTVAGLLDFLGLEGGTVVVELNGALVGRASQSETPLRDGDAVEIVRLVGGG